MNTLYVNETKQHSFRGGRDQETVMLKVIDYGVASTEKSLTMFISCFVWIFLARTNVSVGNVFSGEEKPSVPMVSLISASSISIALLKQNKKRSK